MVKCGYNGHFQNLKTNIVLILQENMGWAYVFLCEMMGQSTTK